MNPYRLNRINDGRYEGLIAGVGVRCVRVTVGVHPHYHTTSKQPHWKVYARAGNVLLADGHTTMHAACDAAARSIGHRGLDKTPEARAHVEAQRRDALAEEHRKNRASRSSNAAARRKTAGKRIL
jgi:Tat protein secretion system quality control protein TatD with DNase activity